MQQATQVKSVTISLLVWLGLAFGLGFAAEAQTGTDLLTVRGKITALKGPEVQISGPAGVVKAVISDNTIIRVEEAIRLTELTAGMYLGTTATKQPDGNFLASEVHVFSDDQRGTGEGHRPLRSAPQSGATMTNADVERVEDVTVQNVKGRIMTLKYKGGEIKVIVPPEIPVVKRVVRNREALKAGLDVSLQGRRNADGALSATQITVRASGR
ncbi:MAG: hypothetical protein ACM3SP_22745 [Chloroflexota bacterium]